MSRGKVRSALWTGTMTLTVGSAGSIGSGLEKTSAAKHSVQPEAAGDQMLAEAARRLFAAGGCGASSLQSGTMLRRRRNGLQTQNAAKSTFCQLAGSGTIPPKHNVAGGFSNPGTTKRSTRSANALRINVSRSRT